jgi:hypothetical protein
MASVRPLHIVADRTKLPPELGGDMVNGQQGAISKRNAEVACETDEERNERGRREDAPSNEADRARIPPRRLPLFVRLSPKNPSKKPEVKNHKTKVSANPQNPPHQPSEKPKATNPKVANNIAKSDTQSRESLPCFVREIAGVEQRNNRLSMAGPAKDSTRLDGKTDMRCLTLALGRFALAMPTLSIRVDCMSNWGE